MLRIPGPEMVRYMSKTRLVALGVITILGPALAAAQTPLFEYLALLDTDNDHTTGCLVTVGGEQFGIGTY
jgi:hypothetical protein